MPAPFGRSWGFHDIPGLEQEIDRLYWVLGKMWGDRKSVSEIGERRRGRNKSLDDTIAGELTVKSLRVGRTDNSRPIERIETFKVAFSGGTIGANSRANFDIDYGTYPQLNTIRRGSLFSLYLDPMHEDLIMTTRLSHASTGDDNAKIIVSLFNTTGGAITYSAGSAYFTLITPRKF